MPSRSVIIFSSGRERRAMTRSWDFWDTLVTRCVLYPREVFELVERCSGIEGFARMREEAEVKSRIGVIETSMDRIYQHLPYSEAVRAQLKQLELDIELAVASPILENVSQLKPQDFIISDMYLGQNHLRLIANVCGFQIGSNNLFISSEYGATKHDGTLYDIVKSRMIIGSHIGDNLHSDIKIPSTKGIKTLHYRRITANATERLWYSRRDHGRFIAGVMRAARLASPKFENGNLQPEWDIFSQIVSPVLVRFVDWVINQSLSKDIKKIYFLSRDGQILQTIAQSLCKARKLELNCEYLYVSRQALHLPGHIAIDESETWILDNTSHLSLKVVAERIGVSPDDFIEISTRYVSAEPDENLDPMQRVKLKSLVRDPEFLRLLDQQSADAHARAITYFRQAGLFDGKNENISIVDVGWNGRIQRSLENILKKAGECPENIYGFFFCLSNQCVYSKGDRICGYLHNPFDAQSPHSWANQYRAMFEFFLSADHPSVSHYEAQSDGKINPVFLDQTNIDRSDVQRRQSAILAFTERYCSMERILGQELIEELDFSIEVLRNFLMAPSYEQARVFSHYQVSEQQVEGYFVPMVKRISFYDAFRRRGGRRWGMWVEGSHALSGLIWIYKLRKVLSHLKHKSR